VYYYIETLPKKKVYYIETILMQQCKLEEDKEKDGQMDSNELKIS